MGVAITPVNINDGDPVTADTLRTIINNVNLVALGDTSSGVTIGDSALSNKAVDPSAPKVYNDTLAGLSVKITADKVKGFSGNVSFAGKTFTTPPVVTANMQFNSTSFANYKYSVVIAKVTTSGFDYYVVPCGPVKSVSCYISWVAVGTFSTTS
jgi:hypothetical protein